MTDKQNQQPITPEEHEESLAEAQEPIADKSEEYLNNWRRALADYDNLKKETASRRAEWAKYSEQQILEEFIPVYEHLKLALQGANESNSWLEGVKHVLKQFGDIFKAHGVEEIKTVGEKFDPNLHEAVGHESKPDGSIHGKPEQDIIVKEIAGGYKMGERVIRAAKVIVAK